MTSVNYKNKPTLRHLGFFPKEWLLQTKKIASPKDVTFQNTTCEEID